MPRDPFKPRIVSEIPPSAMDKPMPEMQGRDLTIKCTGCGKHPYQHENIREWIQHNADVYREHTTPENQVALEKDITCICGSWGLDDFYIKGCPVHDHDNELESYRKRGSRI